MLSLEEQIKSLENIMKQSATSDEVMQVFEAMILILTKYKENAENQHDDVVRQVNEIVQSIEHQNESLIGKVNNSYAKSSNSASEASKILQQMKDLISLVKDGTKGDKGDDGVSPDPQKIIDSVVEEIKAEGLIPKTQEIVKTVIENIRASFSKPKENDATKDTAFEIANKLESLKDDDRLDVSAIKGLIEFIKKYAPGRGGGNTNGGGVQSITSKDGSVIIKASMAKNKGVVDLSVPSSGGGGGFLYSEIPAGAINGSNVTFMLAHVPTSSIMQLFLNGALQDKLSGSPDFTISGSTITFTFAPVSGILIAYYS